MLRRNCLIFISAFLIFTQYVKADKGIKDPKNFDLNSTQQLSFKENKGQISDQFYKPRPDVLFSGTDGSLVFHLKNNGISYQLSRVDKWKEPDVTQSLLHKKMGDRKIPEQITTYRLDVDWLNANKNLTIVKGEALDGYDNYYTETCPNGALGVKSYKQITYQQLYNGIDLKWYEKNGNLKYDYIVAPGSDYKQIRLKLNGAEKISLNKKGELIIKTPLGELIEQVPFVTQNNKPLKANWEIKNNVVSFNIENVNASLPLIIDPLIRLWGTYYGGNGLDWVGTTYTDASGNVFFCGGSTSTNSLSIATVGAHQTTFGGGSSWGDAFLVKFTSGGTRLWGTYYGGTGTDFANCCVVDGSGDVYMSGGTSTSNTLVMVTPGCHQSVYGGASSIGDAFLAKFNTSGIRLWSTYMGGTGDDFTFGMACDPSNNIYITGHTNSNNGTSIATPGSHQPIGGAGVDGFLAKFDPAGTRLWSTYYGAMGMEESIGCITDIAGNVYIGGITSSSTAISTPGCHQFTYGGGGGGGLYGTGDAFFAKFNAAGIRQWGTYYGGTGDEYIYYCGSDAAGDVYFSGSTTSSGGTVIATPGTHQPNYGGGSSDVMLVKFNAAGARLWGSYYGGSGSEDYSCCIADNLNNCIYFSGITSSQGGTVIATPCTYQDTYGGGTGDDFLTKFTLNGTRVWGTYYGGIGREDWAGVGVDMMGNVYLAGETTTPTSTIIASANAQQTNYGGGQYDGFIAKFDGCKPPPNTTPPPNQIICLGENTTLTSTLGCGITWFNAIGGSPIGTGTAISVSPVNTTTFYIDDLSCGISNSPTPVSVTVIPLPTISIVADHTVVCSGNTVNLNTNGANSYTWIPQGSNLTSISLTPTSQITQTIIGSDGTCTNTAEILIDVVPYPDVSVNYFPGPACYASVITFTAFGAQNYTWSPAINLTSTSGTLVSSVPLLQSSTFTIMAENVNGTVSCINQKAFSVNILPALTSQISNSVSICEGDKTTLSAGGGNVYHWMPEAAISDPTLASIIANPIVSTIYSVTISFNDQCPVTRTVSVNVFPKPAVNAGQDTIIDIGDPVSLTATGDGTFNWISGENLSCYNCRVTNILPYTKTCYVVELTDQHNCKAQDEVCVEIINDFGVYIPNTFTPNADNRNDVFGVSYYGIKEIKLSIYDRWGTKIFYTEDQTAVWDGTYKGKDCKVDTYVYKLEFDPYKGKHSERAGHVNLIR